MSDERRHKATEVLVCVLVLHTTTHSPYNACLKIIKHPLSLYITSSSLLFPLSIHFSTQPPPSPSTHDPSFVCVAAAPPRAFHSLSLSLSLLGGRRRGFCGSLPFATPRPAHAHTHSSRTQSMICLQCKLPSTSSLGHPPVHTERFRSF